MVYYSRAEVVAHLRAAASPTGEQLALIRRLALPVEETWPEAVTAALLRAQLAGPLELQPLSLAYDGEVAYLTELADEVGLKVPDGHLLRRELVAAWVRRAHDLRAIRSLEDLKPDVTDIVEVMEATRRPTQVQFGEVVSFSNDGRMNFKGGRGQGARPHQVRVAHRRASDPEGWETAERDLALGRAGQLQPGAMSVVGHRELGDYRIERTPEEPAFAAFQDALDEARDEKPLQRVLERFPELLTHVVSHTQGAWVIPQARLGGAYVPDFLVASETSAGVEWLLVELESPRHPFTIKDGGLAEGPRKGGTQIETWREWLKLNLHMAQRPKVDGGLGLPGISADAPGLVLVGRADLSPQRDWARDRERAGNNIHVRSYDWLLNAAARGRVAGLGALSREIESDPEL